MRLPPGRFTLGRAAECDLCLDEPTVSATHAVLAVTDDAVRIEDLDSRHGVIVNGDPIGNGRKLEHGDEIALGRLRLTFLSPEEPPPRRDTSPMARKSYHPPPAVAAEDAIVGRVLAGAYEVIDIVGQGGMGRVYRARQRSLGRHVALKVLHPELAGEAQLVAHFYNEARAASRLNHPNSVSVFDFGRTEDGLVYLVMEYVHGETLADRVQAGALPPSRSCHIVSEVLSALAAAHALGIVHRDLKPENVILRALPDGPDLVKVVDFGLARIIGEAAPITRPGRFFGTPEYASPEHVMGRDVDGRSDLYSVGVLLFELLTGSRPYTDPSPVRVLWSQQNAPVPDPRQRSAVPDPIAEVVLRAMQKLPEDRFQDALAFRAALHEAVEASRQRADDIECPSCGARADRSFAHCAACGSSLRRERARLSTLPGDHTSPVDRRPELSWIRDARDAAAEPAAPLAWLHVHGGPGVGKSWLLDEVARRARLDGALVVRAGPHASRAPVPYHAIRFMMAQLLRVRPEELERTAREDDRFAAPLVRAGVEELHQPRGLARVPAASRAGAVACALARALRLRLEERGNGPVLLTVDDLDACDGLTVDVLVALRELADDLGAVLLTAGEAPTVGPHSERALAGASRDAAERWLSDADAARLDGSGPVPPLLLEHLPLVSEALGEGEGADLAAVLGLRLEQLDVGARRVLQVLAVLGDGCRRGSLERLAEAADLEHLQRLENEGLVRTQAQWVSIAHPFLRDLVEMSIPDSARRALHDRALLLATDQGEPIEVRAEHAWRGSDMRGAVLMLERMGHEALARGDAATACLTLGRALDLARREYLRTGDRLHELTSTTLGRKLGEALAQRGDVERAHGVLQETLAAVDPQGRERALVLLALARIARRTGREPEPLLAEAIRAGDERRDPTLTGLAYLATALYHRERYDPEQESRYLAGAAARLQGVLRAEVLLARGQALLELMDLERSEEALEAAAEVAASSASLALRAEIVGCRGQLARARGDAARAAERFHEAAELAAAAGDLTTHQRFLAEVEREAGSM